jgi:SWI/SNF-related matrix-associated actin-dependent regulator 1 of chromatin subfamily A
MSMDLLSRKGVLDKLYTLGIKTLVVDECQAFKDSDSKRTEALNTFVNMTRVQNMIFLSGTPIKNRAEEFYPALHLLDPATFHDPGTFRWKFLKLEYDSNGKNPKWNKIKPEMYEEFKRITSRFMIRREKHEVLTNLPPLTRDWQFMEIEDPFLKESYNSTIDLFENYLENKAEVKSSGILGWLAQLRSITGAAKVPYCIDWIKDFLESTDEPIAIGIHHETVRDSLYYALNNAGIKTLKLSGEDDFRKKERILEKFRTGEARVLVINMQAGGVGLNIQTCPNFIVLERQWNAADEEQFEARFHRNGQKTAVTGTYLMAINTIDELYHQYVYSKSHNLASAGIGEGREESESLGSLMDFARLVISKRI